MCGIVGVFAFGQAALPVSQELLVAMRDTMAHRGPDGADMWVSGDRRVGLGFRRLAIIDLSSAAMQPMPNEDGSIWIVFNGEIYNHADIRAELTRLGRHRWRTDHSDTEVIVHAYEEWGINCLHRFRGMFAIALWDARTQELWLARDRIGIKPLYYSVQHGRIAFASEIKALLKDPALQHRVHGEAFYHYLSFLTTPAPQTLFEGVKKLPGGTWLRIRRGGSVLEHRYWDVWDYADPLVGVADDVIAETLLAELRTAVRLRKVSDVPVGVFLSGGIDSSTNAALFSEGEEKPIKTFSIGYQGEHQSYRNELHYARKMAAHVGAEYHELLLSQEDLLALLTRMVHLQDEPIADPVCVPVYYVSKLARDNGITVCQVGEGADELFWGYPSWKRMLWLQRCDDLPVPRIAKRWALGGLQLLGKQERPYYEWLRRGALAQPIFWGGAEAFTEQEKRALLSQHLCQELAGLTSWEALAPIRKRFEDKAWDKSDLNWMTYLDLSLRLPELLLMRVDKMSMGVSLEARVPFLDHKVVELAASIPAKVKTRNGRLKYILKLAVQGLVPGELIERRKQGFGVPVQEWLSGELGRVAHSALAALCEGTDALDSVYAARYLAQGSGPKVWYLLNLALWWKAHLATFG